MTYQPLPPWWPGPQPHRPGIIMPEYVRPAPPTGWKRVGAALFPPLYWYSVLWDEFAPGAYLVTFGLSLAMIWLFKAAMALLP